MLEYTITRRESGATYERPDAVRDLAIRVAKWATDPETCKACSDLPVVRMVRGEALCSRCEATRARRTLYGTGLGRRAVTLEEDDLALQGVAVVFNSRSEDLGGFVETVAPQAADRTFAEKVDVRALWSHDQSRPIGRVSAGTLQLRVTTRGIAASIDPPKWAAAHVETVERRDVSGMSFGFAALADDWRLEDGKPLRELLDVRIAEVSPVAFPAYPATTLRATPASQRAAWRHEEETAARLRRARV